MLSIVKPNKRIAALALALLASTSANTQSMVGQPVNGSMSPMPVVIAYCDDGTGHAAICAQGGGGGGGDPSNIGTVGTTAPTKAGLVGLFDGTAIRVALSDSAGRQIVNINTMPSVTISGTVPVSGTVAVSSIPALVAGSATIGSVNINGTVPVSGTVAATQSGTWTDTVTGNVASGSTDAGNPVKVGGVYNSTLPTYITGQRGDIQIGSRGGVYTIPSNLSGVVMSSLQGNADAQSTTTTGFASMSYPFLYNGTTWDRQPGNAAGGGYVQGAAASGATAAGNPLRNGCIFNSTAPTVTNGQIVDQQCDNRGNVYVSPGAGAFRQTFSNSSTDGLTGSNVGAWSLSVGYLFNGTTWDRARGTTTEGAWMTPKGSATIATGQVSIGTTSTLLVAARTSRSKVTFSVGAANTCAFGVTGVTTSTGYPLQPTAGASLTMDTAAAIYAACSATTTVSYIEQY